MAAGAPSLLDDVVRRYLPAIASADKSLRRRERAHCASLLEHLDDHAASAPTPALVEDWLEGVPSDARRRRLTTLRRLLALTPGADAAELARWLDEHRKALNVDSGDNVVQLFREDSQARQAARREALEARTRLAEGDREQAQYLAARALELDPACMPAHAVVGDLALDDERPFAALQQFRQALVLGGDPAERDGIEGIPDVLAGLGRALLTLGCLEDAREVYLRLARAGFEWRRHSATPLGRIALLLEESETAAEAFGEGPPIDQYNVMLARLRTNELTKAAIAFYRAVLENPLVPARLLKLEDRFAESLDGEEFARRDGEALAYQATFGELWSRTRGGARWLRRFWDYPGTRSFLMRALPLRASNPGSPRFGVLIHAAATAAIRDLGDDYGLPRAARGPSRGSSPHAGHVRVVEGGKRGDGRVA